MEHAEFAEGQVVGRDRGGYFTVQHGTDEGLIVEFYDEAVLQTHESSQKGHDVYKDETFVWIRFPGDRTRETKRRARMRPKGGNRPDPERWPQAWSRYKNRQSNAVDGMPIEEWAPVSKSTALFLKTQNILTVEHLAAVADSNLHHLGTGGTELRAKAIKWLEQAADNAEVLRVNEENAKLKQMLKHKEQQIAELAGRVEAVERSVPQSDGMAEIKAMMAAQAEQIAALQKSASPAKKKPAKTE